MARVQPAASRANGRDQSAQQRRDRAAVAQSALQQAASNSARTAVQAGSGIPQDALSALSQYGVNPDFIAALRRCSEAPLDASFASYQAAMTCNKYSDGSYINAFGPSRGSLGQQQQPTAHRTNVPTPAPVQQPAAPQNLDCMTLWNSCRDSCPTDRDPMCVMRCWRSVRASNCRQ